MFEPTKCRPNVLGFLYSHAYHIVPTPSTKSQLRFSSSFVRTLNLSPSKKYRLISRKELSLFRLIATSLVYYSKNDDKITCWLAESVCNSCLGTGAAIPSEPKLPSAPAMNYAVIVRLIPEARFPPIQTF